jgi:transcriptional regulator with XRE-family HTH domain
MPRENIRTVLALNIRRLREEKGYSQDTLADRAGLNRSYIGSIERAEHNVGIDNINKIANAFNLTVTDLLKPPLADEDDPPAPSGGVTIRESNFTALLEQSSRDEQGQKLILDYLKRCGVKFRD